MDVTILFKACVKTVRTTNKALGIKEQKSYILQRSPKDIHLEKPKEIVKHIKKLHDFLADNKAAYLNVINYLSTNKTMNEVDREKIDETAEKMINMCSSLICEYKKEIKLLAKSEQRKEHYENVLNSIEKYLKNVSKVYAEAKAIRVKRVIETHKLSKLETNKANNNLPPPSPSPPPPPEDIDLSAEEMQMFQSENQLLYDELNAISDEVKQMESKVVHIAQLQETFTEKVLQQTHEIERIATTVVGSTGNIRDANDQIRQAIQRNAGLRVWVLFFLLVMSFSLLFLDWYND